MLQLPGFELENGKQVGLLDGIAIELTEGLEYRGGNSIATEPSPFTRIVAAATKPFPLTARIEFESAFTRLGSWLGAQDVETGDEEFDETFIIKANDEEQVLELLTPELRAALQRAPDTLGVDYKDGIITATWWEHEKDRGLFDAVLQVVTTMGLAQPEARDRARAPRTGRPSARTERRRRLRESLQDSES